MRFSDYCSDKREVLLVCFAGAMSFSVLLSFFGINISEMILLWICYISITFFTILFGYLKRHKRVLHLMTIFDTLDQKYLIAEMIDRPETELEKVYFSLLKTALKDMTDEVANARRMNHEYRDFIEQWIHEIKVPITGIELICENNKTEAMRKIIIQAERIEQDVQKVLFYARLGNVEKDYFIKEISLRQCVLDVLARNKQFFIQNKVCVHTESIVHRVYSDDKWLGFILNQISLNSVKYRSDKPPMIQIESQDMGNYVFLSITDNGIGIRKSELSRVFEKGFVGSNGRTGKNATGIGLYLCAQLCAKLGIGIDVKSEAGKYTTIILYFPKSTYLNV